MDNSTGQNCQEFNKGILQNHMIEHCSWRKNKNTTPIISKWTKED